MREDILNDSGAPFDLDKTRIIHQVFLVPPEQRNDEWLKVFRDNIWHATLQMREPQVIKGPDGFPYLNMSIPEPGKPFESYCVSHVANFCLENGYGIAIFMPGNDTPLWVFGMGMIDSLVRHKSWEGKYSTAGNGGVGEKKEVLVGSPSEDYLPVYARNFISVLMKAYGLAQPKVGNLFDPGVGASLMLNCRVDDFADQETANSLANRVLWYLTPGIGVVFLPQGWDDKNLLPIS